MFNPLADQQDIIHDQYVMNKKKHQNHLTAFDADVRQQKILEAAKIA